MRLAAVAAVVVLAGAGCGGDDPKPLIAASKAAVVRGEMIPDVHLFGEPVVARIDVILNREKVDPEDVRLKTNFEPYERVGETEEERRDIGDFTIIRYTTALNCLNENCIPRTFAGETTVSQLPGLPPFLPGQQRDEKVKFEFPPALLMADAEPKDRTLGRVVWAPLRSLSRINWYDSSVVGQGFPFVTTVAPLPEPDYRISPTLLGLGLLVLALALLALPVWLLWDRRRRRAAPKSDRTAPLSPLEHALRLVEWASRRPSVDERREALEVLAFEIGSDDGQTAERARKQGWSPPTPEPEQMTELVSSIREESDAPPS
ncbi:MAG: hypothetical protein ACRDPX_10285 [Gaiellaceae bacterium]